jgi:DNA-binding transcriptional LysR family regulator
MTTPPGTRRTGSGRVPDDGPVPRSSADPLPGRELAAFVAAVEAAGMHGAAEALHLTQSAITKRVRALEDRLGVTLFERGRYGVRPTEAGRALYPEAKAALAALDRAGQVMRRVRQAERGSLSLAASHTTGEFLLPGLLAAFRAADAEAHVTVEIVNSPGVLERVTDGAVDIGFVEGLDPLDGLETLVLREDDLVVVVAATHRWARRDEVTPSDLRREPFFTREPLSGTRAVATAALAAHGVELVPDLEAASTQSLKRAVLGGGFTILSRLTVTAEEDAGLLRSLRVRGVDLTRQLRAVRRDRAPDGTSAERFWTWLGDRAAAP